MLRAMSFGGKRVLALVPARGGSKGVKRKNLQAVGGVTLLERAISGGLGSEFVDSVVVSSDDQDILTAATNAGAIALERPSHLAEDSTPTAPVIEDALNQLQMSDGLVLLLQPTSPLRTSEHIDAAFRLLGEDATPQDGVLSVVEPDETPFKAFVLNEDGFLRGLVDDEAPFRPRQELPAAYLPNGAIYLFSVSEFVAEGRIPMKRMRPFVMSRQASIDIDRPEDLRRAEAALNSTKEAP